MKKIETISSHFPSDNRFVTDCFKEKTNKRVQKIDEWKKKRMEWMNENNKRPNDLANTYFLLFSGKYKIKNNSRARRQEGEEGENVKAK